MALRDELGKLDSEVASGQISAEQFRAQRDHLLASSGSGPAAGGPFPPPYRWGGPTEGESAADRTQVVSRRPAPGSERTQVVRRPPDADRTQVVRTAPASSGYSTVGAPPWARGPAMTATRGDAPLPLRPEGTLPPWTLNQPLQPPITASTRTTGYADGTAFRARAPRAWLLPLLAALVAIALVAGIVVYVLR